MPKLPRDHEATCVARALHALQAEDTTREWELKMTMTDRPNDRVDDAVDQFLGYLEGETTRPSLAGLTAAEQREAEAIFHLLEMCWGAGVRIISYQKAL